MFRIVRSYLTLFPTALVLALLAPAPGRAAEDQIYIPGWSGPGGTPPVWVSLSGFTGERRYVLEFDLYVQGFAFTNAENAQYLLTGSGGDSFQGRAMDRFNKTVLVAKAYTGSTLRRQVHAFADDFVQALGRKGIAQTKIAFKVEFGAGRGTYDEIYVADFDGHDAQAVTGDHVITAAPCWVPGRFALYYGSYKLGNSAIFSHDLTTGTRKTVAWYGGSSISPAVSPNGRKVAMILSKDGWTDLYVADADGSNLKRLTHSPEDESSPCWSQPDGQWICFATRIKERRALCKVPAAGGAVQRIPTVGVLNPTEPDWSPDGKWIAFTAQMGGFEICVMPSQGGPVTELVSGEDPSWAPNSRTLAYYRRSGSRLSMLDVPTKQVKDVPRVSSGENSQPSWAR